MSQLPSVKVAVANNPTEMTNFMTDGRFIIISVVMVDGKGYVTYRKVTFQAIIIITINKLIHAIGLQATPSETHFEATVERTHVIYRNGSIYEVETIHTCIE